MGISGLLPFLKPVTNPAHLDQFKDQTLAIDGYILLHRASLIEDDFETETGKAKLRQYFVKWIEMFQYFKVKPYFVLDGSSLPSKQVTNEARKKVRTALRESAEALLAQGRTDEANDALRRSRGVTPLMVQLMLALLKERDVPFIVAPYEADAQMAYLAREKLVAGVVTEDSDLLVFGCPTVIFKLDLMGRGDMIESKDLFSNSLSPFFGTNLERLRHVCILSGCDYLPNIAGIGLKTSFKMFDQHSSLSGVRCFIEGKRKYIIPPTYWNDFDRANQTFLYQKVYCPQGRIVKNLNFLPANLDCVDFLKINNNLDDPKELQQMHMIATGKWCPKTLKPYPNLTPAPVTLPHPLVRVTSQQGASVPAKGAASNTPTLHRYFEVKNKLKESPKSIFNQLYSENGVQKDLSLVNGQLPKTNGNGELSKRLISPYFKNKKPADTSSAQHGSSSDILKRQMEN